MSSALHLSFRLMVFIVKALGYALYGAWRLASGLLRLPRRITATRLLLRESLTCPWCDEENPVAGRYSCRACGAQFMGGVLDPCHICHAIPSFVPCRHCQGAIDLRGGR